MEMEVDKLGDNSVISFRVSPHLLKHLDKHKNRSAYLNNLIEKDRAKSKDPLIAIRDMQKKKIFNAKQIHLLDQQIETIKAHLTQAQYAKLEENMEAAREEFIKEESVKALEER